MKLRLAIWTKDKEQIHFEKYIDDMLLCVLSLIIYLLSFLSFVKEFLLQTLTFAQL